MVVRAVTGKDQRYSATTCGPRVFQGRIINFLKGTENNNHQEVDHIELEAVMGSALETMTRYQTKLKRDLYRAMETLRKMQAERREGEE